MMRLPTILLGSLLVGSAAATPAALERRVCAQDNLFRCFTNSLSLAKEYCTLSVALSGLSSTVTVTPTVYVVFWYLVIPSALTPFSEHPRMS